MSVTPEEVRRIAELARLRLDDDEATSMARDMTSILEHMEALAAADVERVREPEAASDAGSLPGGAGALTGSGAGAADDEPAPKPPRPQRPDPLALPVPELAPDWRDGFFVVPRLPAVEGGRDEEGSAPS